MREFICTDAPRLRAWKFRFFRNFPAIIASKSYAVYFQDVFVWKQVRLENFARLNSFQRSWKTLKIVQFSRLAFHYKLFKKEEKVGVVFPFQYLFLFFNSHNSANNSLLLLFIFSHFFWYVLLFLRVVLIFFFSSQRKHKHFSSSQARI